MKRRGFIKSVGAAIGGSAAISQVEAKAEAETPQTFHPGAGVQGAAAPIVFDPEILDIIRAEAPILQEIPTVKSDMAFESDISGEEIREMVESVEF